MRITHLSQYLASRHPALKYSRFVNTISDAYQAEEPPQFPGGIIADSMGLGKTLTMIALVATYLEASAGSAIHEHSMDDNEFDTSATLNMMPPTRIAHTHII